MVTTYRLLTLAHAIEVATTLTKSWFRGHSRPVGALTPRIFRPEYHDPILTGFRPALEMELIETFKRRAAMITELQVPPDDDRLGWLCVMQHYRTPTRLLDWTENLLVALHFAVSSDRGEDGELWALLPWALNEAAGAGWGIPLPGSSPVRYMLDQPYWARTPEELAKYLELKRPITSPLAIQPPLRFARMAVQASTFTIHPAPDGSKAIADVLSDERHLVRYVIPGSEKQHLQDQLRVLGISDGQLFPDLEGLSRMIAFDNRTIAYGVPKPLSVRARLPKEVANAGPELRSPCVLGANGVGCSLTVSRRRT